MAAKNKGGRPSKYSQDVADRICKAIAEGQSLRAICRDTADDHDMPTRQTVRMWLRENDEFSSQYTRAREEQADFYADEMIEIADTTDDPNQARLQIDARKWKAARMAPRKWGDVSRMEHSGPGGGAIPTQTTITVKHVSPDDSDS